MMFLIASKTKVIDHTHLPYTYEFQNSIQYEWLRPNVKARQKESIIKYMSFIYVNAQAWLCWEPS